MNDKIKKYYKLDNTKRVIKSEVYHVKNSTDILTDVRLAADFYACACRLSARKYRIVRSLSRLIALAWLIHHQKKFNLGSYVLSEQRVWACVSTGSVI